MKERISETQMEVFLLSLTFIDIHYICLDNLSYMALLSLLGIAIIIDTDCFTELGCSSCIISFSRNQT